MVHPEQLNEWITLYEGDCLKVLPQLKWGVIECVFTSPPYNLGGEPWPHLGNWKPGDAAVGKSKWRNGSDAGAGIQYGDHDDNMPHEKYCQWQRAVISQLWRIIPDDGAIFYNHKPRVIGARLWTPFELIPMDVVLRQIIIWLRSGGVNFNPTAYLPTHEWVMLFAKQDFRLRDKSASGIGDVWKIHQAKNPEHPAPFPVELPANAMQTVPATMWLDPFAGSGTTAIAAMKEGRKCVLIEKDPAYCSIIRERVRKADGREPGTIFANVDTPDLFANC